MPIRPPHVVRRQRTEVKVEQQCDFRRHHTLDFDGRLHQMFVTAKFKVAHILQIYTCIYIEIITQFVQLIVARKSSVMRLLSSQYLFFFFVLC